MDLIYTNANQIDQGVLLDYTFDLAFGIDENDFECRICADAHCCEAGSYLYIEGTEYGGIVDSIESNSETDEVIYRGRTWHGILDSKIIMPDSGQDYLTVNGEANTVIASLISRLGLNDLFVASTKETSITIRSYNVPRYISAYEGIIKILNTANAKLDLKFSDGKCVLQAVPRMDYSADEEFDASIVPLKVKKIYKTVNHLIVLGSGQLKNRKIVHLYADEEGNIGQFQSITGIDEIVDTYELSNESEMDALISQGTSHFRELLSTGSIDISLNSDDDQYGISDIFGSYDNITKIFVAEKITKKIVSIKDGIVSVEYGTEKTTSSSSESGGAGEGSDVTKEYVDTQDQALGTRIDNLTAADVGINYPVGFGTYINSGTNASLPSNFRQGVSIGYTFKGTTYPLEYGNLLTVKASLDNEGSRGLQLVTDNQNRIMTRTSVTTDTWTSWSELAKNDPSVSVSHLNVSIQNALIGQSIGGIAGTGLTLLPTYSYTNIGTDTTDADFFKKYLKVICAAYPNTYNRTFFGKVTPNSVGIAILSIYDTADCNAEGLPRYSSGLYIGLNGAIIFGTYSYNFRIKGIGSYN